MKLPDILHQINWQQMFEQTNMPKQNRPGDMASFEREILEWGTQCETTVEEVSADTANSAHTWAKLMLDALALIQSVRELPTDLNRFRYAIQASLRIGTLAGWVAMTHPGSINQFTNELESATVSIPELQTEVGWISTLPSSFVSLFETNIEDTEQKSKETGITGEVVATSWLYITAGSALGSIARWSKQKSDADQGEALENLIEAGVHTGPRLLAVKEYLNYKLATPSSDKIDG